MIIWVIAGLLGLATGLRIGWALVNKQSLVSAAMILALGSLGLVAALNWQPLTLLIDTLVRWPNVSTVLSQVALDRLRRGQLRDDHVGVVGPQARDDPPHRDDPVRRGRRHRGADAGRVLHLAPAARDGARGVSAAQPRRPAR